MVWGSGWCSCFRGSDGDGAEPGPGSKAQQDGQHSDRPQQASTQPAPAYGKEAYALVGQMGTGRNGTMKLMRNKKTKELVAAKWVPRTVGGGLSKNTEREIVNHRKLLHPNIIRFREVEPFVVARLDRRPADLVVDCSQSRLEGHAASQNCPVS